MTNVLILLLVAVLVMYFWQLRKMAELSVLVAKGACKKQKVQFLAIAMESARPSLGGSSGLCWRAQYRFDFSSDGVNQFQGTLWLKSQRLEKVEWPVFPEPAWD